ncbi:MAG: fused MFS/spermidine synthase [Verrucomicrobiota bacterium]
MRLAIVSGLLFLSGISALIFEVLWLRVAGLAFGNSIWAAALILSSFMAGLACGNTIAAFLGKTRWRPVVCYGWLEFMVGLTGLSLIFVIPLVGTVMRPAFQILADHQTLLNSLRFGISFLILLGPTSAMGLTLPLLLADSGLQATKFNRAVGLLYGFNTLGAVLGALSSEMFLIQRFGLAGTGMVAGALSFTAAGLAFLLLRTGSSEELIRPKDTPVHALRVDYQLPWRPLLVSFGTGVIALSLEIVWFRLLHLYVASTSAAFAIMLAVVLAGIAIGGILAALPTRRLANAPVLLPGLLLLAAIATLLTYILFPAPVASAREVTTDLQSWGQIAWLSFALIFPVALISGALLPLIAARVQANVLERTNAAGLTNLSNTLGATIGPLIAGFVLLPTIGFQSALVVCAVAYALLAVLATEPSNSPGPIKLAVFSLAALMIGTTVFFPVRRDRVHFANARFVYETDGSRLVRKVESTSDTLQLLRCDLLGQPYYYRLVTNGFSMSSTIPRSQRYMRLFAYLPLALRPESENVLQICYGVGVTADALVADKQLLQIEIVDISKEVFNLALEHFPSYPDPLRDPRVKPIVQDGRYYLQATRHKYDVITGEPPPLKAAGTVNLYTKEFFALMKSRLKPNGIVSFWLPIYQLTIPETKSILAAFHAAFPNASVWGSSDDEWIMLGINGDGASVTGSELGRLWRNGSTRDDLCSIGIENPTQLAALYLMDGSEIDRITRGIEPLSDWYPKRLGDEAPDLSAVRDFATPYMEAANASRAFHASELIERIWPQAQMAEVDEAFVLREMSYRARVSGSNWLAELDVYLRRSRLRAPVLTVLQSDEERVSIAEKLARQAVIPAAARPDLVAGALARRDFAGAIKLLELGRKQGFNNENDFFLLTYLYCLNGNVAKAEALAANRAEGIPRDWFVNWLWGDLQAEFGFHPPG